MASVNQKISAFFSKYKIHYIEKDQLLIEAGQDPPGIVYLISGQIVQYDTRQKSEAVVNIFKQGAFFPMSWAINKTPNAYFYKSFTRTLYRLAPADEVVEFLHANPDVLFDLLSRVYRGTDSLLERQVYLMNGSAKQRIVYEILIECRRFKKQRDGICTLDITEKDLASRVGLTRETINRELHNLKQKDLIRISSKGIGVPDADLLQAELSS